MGILFANRRSLLGDGPIGRQSAPQLSFEGTAYSRQSSHPDPVEILHDAQVQDFAPCCQCYLST